MHTKEPWIQNHDDILAGDNPSDVIAECAWTDGMNAYCNARRIVACVNAHEEHMTQTDIAPILERLTAALERPAIPLDKQLWDAKHVAAYLGVKVRTVTDNYRFVPGFPECFRLPSEKGLGGLRWKMQWADRQG